MMVITRASPATARAITAVKGQQNDGNYKSLEDIIFHTTAVKGQQNDGNYKPAS